MHQRQYCGKLLYAPLRFCSTEHTALFHRVSDLLAWTHYQGCYEECRAERQAQKKIRAARGTTKGSRLTKASLSILLLVAVMFGGCAGEIVTKKYNLDGDAKGVLFRLVRPQMEYLTYTTLPGQITCTPQLRNRIVEGMPADDWYAIGYEPEKFERHKFSVVLNPNGTLNTVNMDSTPITLKDLVEAATTLAPGLPATLFPKPEQESEQEQNDKKGKNNDTISRPCTETPFILGRCLLEDNGTPIKECVKAVNDELQYYKANLR